MDNSGKLVIFYSFCIHCICTLAIGDVWCGNSIFLLVFYFIILLVRRLDVFLVFGLSRCRMFLLFLLVFFTIIKYEQEVRWKVFMSCIKVGLNGLNTADFYQNMVA